MTARKRGRPRKKKAKALATEQSTLKQNTEIASPDTGESSTGKNDTPSIGMVSEMKQTLDLDLNVNHEITMGEMKDQRDDQVEPKRTFVEVVGFKEESNLELKFVQSEKIDGVRMARMSEEDLMDIANYWEATLLCCVLGANPPLKIMDGFLRRIWKEYSIEEISVLREGQFVVQFGKSEY
ncbi:unnamed protein product [Cuscuta campestris]|uniref:DUF4283 domain-containing protein n=1 Tax=Cuscuta campestris TaxID=132261 RepID=A0A484MEM5_9ASTE|nr:unnamed protein product [Cuscuta campestris]